MQFETDSKLASKGNRSSSKRHRGRQSEHKKMIDIDNSESILHENLEDMSREETALEFQLIEKIIEKLIVYSALCPTQLSAMLGVSSMDTINSALGELERRGIAEPTSEKEFMTRDFPENRRPWVLSLMTAK